jgi:hypothetical protein
MSVTSARDWQQSEQSQSKQYPMRSTLVTKWFVSENRRNSLKSRATSLVAKLRCSAIKPRSWDRR